MPYYCFCESGCEKEAKLKSEILTEVEQKLSTLLPKHFYVETTVTSGMGQAVITISNAAFTEDAFIEVYPADDATRRLLSEHMQFKFPTDIGLGITIPLLNATSHIGDPVKFNIKVGYYNLVSMKTFLHTF